MSESSFSENGSKQDFTYNDNIIVQQISMLGMEVFWTLFTVGKVQGGRGLLSFNNSLF